MNVLHALEATASASRSAEDVTRRRFTLLDWESGRYLSEYLRESLSSESSKDSALASAESISKLLHTAHSVDIMKATLNGLLDSITDLQDGFKLFVAPISSKLSRGITSLPDELIGLIFKYASAEIGTKQAVWLSHVSRAFRRIAVSEVDLWATLHSRARPDEIETYVSRSRQADLHVVVNITPDEYNEDLLPLFTSCFASASRLKSLSITAELDDREYPSNFVLSNELTDLDTGELVFPRLEELSIFHYKKKGWGMHSDNFAFGEFSPSWDAPALRTIRCSDYIPAPTATAFTSITSFSLQFSLRTENDVNHFGWLLEFLESASSLSDFDLEIFDAERSEIQAPLALSTTRCPSITSFSLRITSLSTPRGTDKFLAPFIRSLHVPNLQRYSVSVKLDYRNLVDRANLQRSGYLCTDFVSPIVEASLPDPLIHTRFTSLSLALTWELPTEMQRTWIDTAISSKKVFIPLNRIPFVTELSLSMHFHAAFIGNKSEQLSGRGYHPTKRPCALRKLCLCDCAYMVIWQLQEIVQSLKELGAWDALERFIVEDRTSVAPDRALEAVGPERFTFIRSST